MGQQAQRHGPREPQPEFLIVLVANPERQAILAFVILDRHLVNVHSPILGPQRACQAQLQAALEK